MTDRPLCFGRGPLTLTAFPSAGPHQELLWPAPRRACSIFTQLGMPPGVLMTCGGSCQMVLQSPRSSFRHLGTSSSAFAAFWVPSTCPVGSRGQKQEAPPPLRHLGLVSHAASFFSLSASIPLSLHHSCPQPDPARHLQSQLEAV